MLSEVLILKALQNQGASICTQLTQVFQGVEQMHGRCGCDRSMTAICIKAAVCQGLKARRVEPLLY